SIWAAPQHSTNPAPDVNAFLKELGLTSLAIIFPRTSPTPTYNLASAIGPQAIRNLSRIFSDLTLCLPATSEAVQSSRRRTLQRSGAGLVEVDRTDPLGAAIELANTLRRQQWSIILAISHCAPLHSIASLRKANFAFHGTKLMLLTDSSRELRLEGGPTDILLACG